jgi:NTP pyrophosphatase (non-canonical NTP hydrolase)
MEGNLMSEVVDPKKPEVGGVQEPLFRDGETYEILGGLHLLESCIARWAKAKGWLVPGAKRNPHELLMLITSELGEACEAYRTGNPRCDKPNMEHFTNAEEELADAIIRILQMSAEYGYNLPAAIIAKMQYNHTRPHKHGKLA